MIARWIKERDRNTKLFHNMTNYYWRSNYVEVMEIDDRLVKGNECLRHGVKDFFFILCCEDFIICLNWMVSISTL